MRALALTLLVLTLVLGTGCGDDSPTDPGDSGGSNFSIADHFTPEEATVEERESDTRMIMVGVRFVTGSANLADDSLPVLDKFREVFAEMPGARFAIEGHTDNRGSSNYNQRISEDRAIAVRDYLVDEVGGPGAAMSTIGYGETRPIEDNATALGRAANRRIEIIVQDPTGAPLFNVTLQATHLDVIADCDAGTGSPSVEAGDFYITLELLARGDRGVRRIARVDDVLVQLNSGESRDLQIAVEGQFIGEPGERLEARAEIMELDGGGVRQFDRSSVVGYRYDPGAGCWKKLGNEKCIDSPANALHSETMPIIDVLGDLCSLSFSWQLRAEEIANQGA